MSLFIDKHNRRKSPIILAAFGAALADLAVFGLCYSLLAEPLYRTVDLGSSLATNVVHALLIAAVGTAVCCLAFFLPDKRVAPYGFALLAAVLGMFCAAAVLLDEERRSLMLYLIAFYGLCPVLLGNAVSWPVYFALRRSHPVRRPRTIAEELREAIAQEQAKGKRGTPGREPPAAQKTPEEPPVPTAEEALFGPEGSAGGPGRAFRNAQEEAMLLYVDGEDEDETGND